MPITAVPPGAEMGKYRRLDAGIVLERAVAVEMVGRDVEQRRGVGREPRRKLDLEGGKLEHISEIGGERFEIEHRLADIAAERHALSRRLEKMRGERGRGGFAVGAGDDHHLARRRVARPLAEEQLDIADHLDARSLRAARRSNAARGGSAECRGRAPARRSPTSRRSPDRARRSLARQPAPAPPVYRPRQADWRRPP